MNKCALTMAVVAFASRIAVADSLVVGTQADSIYADSEVATNVAFNACRSDTKNLEIRIDAAMVRGASVSVALGMDADGDGDLSAEETEFMMGMSGESCFLENVSTGIRYYDWADARNGEDGYFSFKARTDRDFCPRSVEIACENGELFAALGAQPWMFKRSWNLMKIVRRGVKAVNETCKVDNRHRAMMMLFR